MAELERTALGRFLKNQHPEYYGKVVEVRREVAGWLTYVPQTFPHYTRHTIEHSEEIIAQISKLLFRDEDDNQPVLVTLSGVEAYVLVVAAFLHDAGMVASDAEKLQILSSAEWKTWIGSGGGAKRWSEVDEFANGSSPQDTSARAFLADIQRRFLIAEYIRRVHHERSARVVRQHHDALGRLAFGDSSLAETIADICEAHGFRAHELDNHEKFPDRRDLRDGTVNVRLMAILLRLGDLLDMSYDRACPLLLNVACPLPADSYAHWTQYQRIKHRMTSSDRIEITAECMQQEEHRFLYDWCKWLVEEIRAASVLMQRAQRHGEWRPPNAEIEGEKATIAIRRHRDAKYIPSTWTFELDRDAVFQRLIHDAYSDARTFLRELIQNAADASRCALYSMLPAGHPVMSPTKIEAGLRGRFPIVITIGSRTVVNAMSKESEEKQVITIEDSGIGMDRSVVEHFFLQIGRSFYITEEFRRTYAFTASSRFGVGFLSVFAVSDDVEVETMKAGSPDGALLLRLTGPKTYLLTEQGSRTRPGTRVTLIMRKRIEEEDCVDAVRHWCKRLELPVVLTTSKEVITIEAERPEDFAVEVPDLSEPDAVLRIRAFPIDEDGVEGELYIPERETGESVTWLDYEHDRDSYALRFPFATDPHVPRNMLCVSGIDSSRVGAFNAQVNAAARVDFRGSADLPLSRNVEPGYELPLKLPAVRNRVIAALKEHLSGARTASGVITPLYRQHLARAFIVDELWNEEPAMIDVRNGGNLVQLSHRDAAQLPQLGVTVARAVKVAEFDHCPLLLHSLRTLSRSTHRAVFSERAAKEVISVHGALVVIFALGNATPVLFGCELITIPSSLVGIGLIKPDYSWYFLLNQSHPLVSWLVRAEASLDEVWRQRLRQLGSSVKAACSYNWKVNELTTVLKAWATAPGLPEDLKPPTVELTPESFGFTRG